MFHICSRIARLFFVSSQWRDGVRCFFCQESQTAVVVVLRVKAARGENMVATEGGV